MARLSSATATNGEAKKGGRRRKKKLPKKALFEIERGEGRHTQGLTTRGSVGIFRAERGRDR